MASQEDYLDNLLKDMAGGGAKREDKHNNPQETGRNESPVSESEAPGSEEELFPEPEAFSAEEEFPSEPEAFSAEEFPSEPEAFSVEEEFPSEPEAFSAEEEFPSEPATFDEEEQEDDLISADSGDSTGSFFGVIDEMLSDDDVLKMLADSDESSIGELQDLLEKAADSGKTVDFGEAEDDIFREELEEVSQAGKEKTREQGADLSETEDDLAEGKKESPAERRERKKAEAAERKARKQAAREAAKQAKTEKKEKKEKEAKKEPKPEKKASETDTEKKEAVGRNAEIEVDLMDKELLDSILSEANITERKTDIPAEAEEQPEPFDIDAEAGMTEEPADTAFGDADSAQGMKDDLGLDINDMFQNTDIDFSGEGDNFAFTDDAVELDLEEADQMIPERDEASDGGKKGKEKTSLFSRIQSFLMEEDEEEKEDPFFQENKAEGEEAKDKSGGKKSKKGGASKKDAAKSKKDAKPKKPAKPKKAPAAKKAKEPKKTLPSNGPGLPIKKALPIVLIGVSVGVLLLVFVNAATTYTDRKNARTAFYMGDYDTCYQNLKGKKLDETESIMFGKSESILYSRIWTREYKVFMESGDHVRALDSLIQAIAYYPELQEYAARWNALSEVAAGYAEVLNLLESSFGLSESQAKEIAGQRRDADYTRMIRAITEGKSPEGGDGSTGTQTTPDTPENPEEPGETEADGNSSMADLLPEEEEVGGDTFIGNE